jgi:predicted ATP-dependent endonuclease of OLD family
MIVKKIQIEEYRSCLNTTFELDPRLSILIGPNGSGKTNVLCALLLLKKLVYEDEYYYFRHEGEKPTGQCRLKVWFELEKKSIVLTSKINTYIDEENKDIIITSKQQWYLKDFTNNAKRINFPLRLAREISMGHAKNMSREFMMYHRSVRREHLRGLPNMEVIKILNKVAEHLSEIKYYSASQFTNPANCPVSFQMEKEGRRSRGVRLGGHSKFLFDLFAEYKSAKESRYHQFFDIIGPKGIGLVDDIDFQEILTSSIDYSVRSGGKIREQKRERILVIPKFKIDKHELSPNQLSEGTFKTITLLFYLITETSSILLIEEPEVCVHHGLLSSIINLIKTYSADKQIIVSTHSDFVLDKVGPENVHKVSRTPGEGTKVNRISKTISKKEFVALKHYLDHEGNLGEYWKHGALE